MANRQMRAALLALFASATLSFIDNFVGPVAEEASIWQFQVVRTLIVIPILLTFARVTGQRVRPVSLRKTALRSFAVSTGLLIYFAALGVLPVAQAGAGLFSAPIWVLLFSALLFAARITLFQVGAMLTGFAGVLMLLQPDLTALSVLSLMPLVAGIFYGLGMLLTPYLCQDETPIALAMGIFVIMGTISLALLAYFTVFPVAEPTFLTGGWVAPTSRFFWLTALQGVGAVIAVSCIAEAYRIGTPSYVAVFEYSFLIFASLWAFLLWGLVSNAMALAGIIVILVSGVALTLRQARDDAVLPAPRK